MRVLRDNLQALADGGLVASGLPRCRLLWLARLLSEAIQQVNQRGDRAKGRDYRAWVATTWAEQPRILYRLSNLDNAHATPPEEIAGPVPAHPSACAPEDLMATRVAEWGGIWGTRAACDAHLTPPAVQHLLPAFLAADRPPAITAGDVEAVVRRAPPRAAAGYDQWRPHDWHGPPWSYRACGSFGGHSLRSGDLGRVPGLGGAERPHLIGRAFRFQPVHHTGRRATMRDSPPRWRELVGRLPTRLAGGVLVGLARQA